MHAYVTIPGDKTSYLSELRSGREVIVVDQNGLWRTLIVGRVKIESRPLILVEAKVHENDLHFNDNSTSILSFLTLLDLLQENSGKGTYSIFLQNAETVALITPDRGRPIVALIKIMW